MSSKVDKATKPVAKIAAKSSKIKKPPRVAAPEAAIAAPEAAIASTAASRASTAASRASTAASKEKKIHYTRQQLARQAAKAEDMLAISKEAAEEVSVTTYNDPNMSSSSSSKSSSSKSSSGGSRMRTMRMKKSKSKTQYTRRYNNSKNRKIRYSKTKKYRNRK